MKPGKLIVFEGLDGVGKSTLARCLVDRLTEWGIESEYATFPGRRPGTLGSVVYEIHHDPRQFGIEGISPASLQALHIAAHLDAIEGTILRVLSEGTWIILDRFWWSTFVYGRVAGVDQPVLDAMIQVEKIVWKGTEPDVLVLVDRSQSANDQEKPMLHKEYRALYGSERNRYPVCIIQNDRPLSDTVNAVLSILDDLFGGMPRDSGSAS